MKGNWTPGPWWADYEHGFLRDFRGNIICQFWGKDEEDFDNINNNFRLAAESPAMIEQLIKRVRYILDAYPGASIMSNMIGLEFGQLERIIERATGKSIDEVLKGE